MKKILQNTTLKLFLGAIILFCGIWFYMPSAGIVRTLPLVIVSGLVARLFMKDNLEVFGFSFFISFILSCAKGQSTVMAAVLGFACGFFAFSGAFVLEGIKVAVGNKKQGTSTFKGTLHHVLMLAISLGLYVLVCGNIFSVINHNNANLKYLDTNYKGMVKETYTYYSIPEFAYRTSVVFEYKDAELVGSFGNCYIQNKDGVITDGVRDRYEEDIVAVAKKSLASHLGDATDFFAVLSGDIEFKNNEIIKDDDVPAMYYKRVNYAVGVYNQDMDKARFTDICKRIKQTLSTYKGYGYESILIVGANANEPVFTCTITGNKAFEESDVCEFDKKALKKFGITSDDVLSAWS